MKKVKKQIMDQSVYLSGPIFDCTDSACKEWREIVSHR